jgi:hypothetical protein
MSRIPDEIKIGRYTLTRDRSGKHAGTPKRIVYWACQSSLVLTREGPRKWSLSGAPSGSRWWSTPGWYPTPQEATAAHVANQKKRLRAMHQLELAQLGMLDLSCAEPKP